MWQRACLQRAQALIKARGANAPRPYKSSHTHGSTASRSSTRPLWISQNSTSPWRVPSSKRWSLPGKHGLAASNVAMLQQPSCRMWVHATRSIAGRSCGVSHTWTSLLLKSAYTLDAAASDDAATKFASVNCGGVTHRTRWCAPVLVFNCIGTERRAPCTFQHAHAQ